ncbi:hypothetical protein AB0C59_15175 [Streptomyces sp. NPDC048664]|uniref:hypothetical protein n=1 Tax=Streptomyces sp. NPDC048664 TaxID=3154505 RepID=UPI00343320AC
MPSASSPRASHRAPSHAAPRGAVTALRTVRHAVLGAVAVVILIGGVWGSWGTAQYVMLTKGRERGTIEVTRCGADTCHGPFTPLSTGAVARGRVVIGRSAAVQRGRTYTVVLKPGSDEVVRSGPAGVLYAWIPLGGALLLASVVVAGGLRLARAAWLLAGAGILLLTSAFAVI